MATLDPQRVKEFLSRRRPAVNWDDNIDPLAEMLSAAESQEPQVSSPSRRVILPREQPPMDDANLPPAEYARLAAPPQDTEQDPIRAYVKRRLGSLNQATNAPQVNPDMERNARLQPALANFAGAIDQLGGAAPKAWVSSDVASRDLGQRQDMAEFLARRQQGQDQLAGRMADIQSGTGRQAYNQAELARRVKADADRAQAAEDKRKSDALTLDKKLEAKRLEDEAKTRRAGAAAGVKKQEIADKKKGDLAASELEYAGEIYRPATGQPLNSTILNRAMEVASDANGARAAMQALRGALADAIASPVGSEKRQAAESDLSFASTALNKALGQGAMAGNEYDRIKQSLGTVTGQEFILDAARKLFAGDSSASSNVLARIDSALPMLDRVTKAKLKGMRMSTGSGEAWPVGEVRTDKNGNKLRKREDGKLEVVK